MIFKKYAFQKYFCVTAVVLSAGVGANSWAGLGRYPSLGAAQAQIARDVKDLRCAPRCGEITLVGDNSAYKVFQMAYQGYVLREFVSLSGNIFAVSWSQGLKVPDPQIILGEYYQEQQSAEAIRHHVAGRSPLVLETKKLRFYQGGHSSGGLRGSAIALDLMPESVSIEEVK